MQINSFLRKHLSTLLLLVLFSIGCFVGETASAQDSAKSKKSAVSPVKGRVLYGKASFYSNKFNGRRTASGETFNQGKLTCACNVLPLGTWVKVTNIRNGKSVVVKVNDRLHPKMKRIVDLTRAAANKLGFVSAGLARVKVEVLGKKAPAK